MGICLRGPAAYFEGPISLVHYIEQVFLKKAVILGELIKELRVIYFPTIWGAKEPQNLPNHRVDIITGI